jgi:hypothetical protein
MRRAAGAGVIVRTWRAILGGGTPLRSTVTQRWGMRTIAVLVVLCAGSVAGRAGAQTHEHTSAGGVAFTGGDGSSLAQAVIITGGGATGDVDAENAWLKQHLPGAKKVAQALIENGGHSYDRLTLTMPDGNTRKVFFDVTSGMQGLEKLFGGT